MQLLIGQIMLLLLLSVHLHKLSEAQLLLLFVFFANHLDVAVLPHALPQFDGAAAYIFTWTNKE